MRPIVTEAELDTVLAEPLVVLYKHSPICPTSSMAYEEIRVLGRLHGDVPVYLVDVVHHRSLARQIAERIGVRHASPQAIILRAGVPAWHGSHSEVRAAGIAHRLTLLKDGE